HAEATRDGRRRADRLRADLAAELRTRVAGAVEVVLAGDVGQGLAHLVVADAELLGVRRRHHAEHGRGREGAAGPVAGRVVGVEPLVPAVLHLLDADGHGDVVRARRHRIGGLPERLRPAGAVVLDTGDGLALDLQRPGQGDAAHARLGRTQPEGVDLLLVD